MIFFRFSLFLLFTAITPFIALSQQLILNEVMSSNLETLRDRDGDTPDWIEIYNPSVDAINLQNYGLSDNLENIRWIFPSVTIQPEKHLLIFASDKDLKGPLVYWETIIDIGDEWSYQVPDSNTNPEWRTIGFDDSEWPVGKSGFGYGDEDDSTIVQGANSLFLRKNFQIDDLSTIDQLVLHLDYDDGFVLFINDVEVTRRNISSTGPPAFDQLANDNHEAQMYLGGLPEVFQISTSFLTEGENTISLQIHNVNTNSSDMSAIPFLSLGGSQNNAGYISSNIPLVNQRLHTDFKLKSEGETLYLTNPEGQVIDSVVIPSLIGDVSYGRATDHSTDWVYFDQSTPESSNNSTGYEKLSGQVEFSIPGGNYTSSIEVSLQSSGGGEIYYTIDGTKPDLSKELYITPLQITDNTIIRAREIDTQAIPGKIETQSYFINSEHSLPIVSLVTDPENLWNFDSGIYVSGPNAQSSFPFFGSNFWEDWERPIHIELYQTDGSLSFSQDAGVKIFGGWSRGNSQKSLTIHARQSYGSDRFDYPIFESKQMDSYKNIVLRNSGNDWGQSMFRDGLMSSLFHESVDRQGYQPSVVYLNGVYWGIHNIREKINEHFVENNHGVPTSEVNLLEFEGNAIYGTDEEYRNLINFIQARSLSDDQDYQYVAARVDIMNFIYYNVGNIYAHNTDWPGNNIKFWKQSGEQGRWRWIAFDTDFGFGLWDYFGKVSGNTIAFALEPNGPGWPNPPWSTLLFRRLMTNNDFKELFINTLADEMNTRLLPENVLARINEIIFDINSEMSAHFNRWNGSMNSWNENVNYIKRFALERPQYLINHTLDYFNISSTYTLELEVNNSNFGAITLNSITPESYPWSGNYYNGIPVTLTAVPKPGYRFVGWEGDVNLDELSIRVPFNSNTLVKAIFEAAEVDLGQLIINEINYNSPEDNDAGDWIEFYNRSDQTLDLSNWSLIDDGSEESIYIFPQGARALPGEFLVMVRDMEKFKAVHPSIPVFDTFDFGLSSEGECIRLFSDEDKISDLVCYGVEDPWPEAANNLGSTIALKAPFLDNELAFNWYGLQEGGNPGFPNDIVLGIEENNFTSLSFYPNPVQNTGRLEFELTKNVDAVLRIIDLSGRVLLETEHRLFSGKQSMLVDFNTLRKGVYILELSLKNEFHTLRIVKY